MIQRVHSPLPLVIHRSLLLFHGPVNRINVRTLKLSELLATAASWDPERTKGSPLSRFKGRRRRRRRFIILEKRENFLSLGFGSDVVERNGFIYSPVARIWKISTREFVRISMIDILSFARFLFSFLYFSFSRLEKRWNFLFSFFFRS